MKYVKLRGDTYYYRRQIPVSIQHLSTIKTLHKSLSQDKVLAVKLATRYNNLFNILMAGHQLGRDINSYIIELGLNQMPSVDIYGKYINSREVGKDRLAKIVRVLEVVKVLLPKELSKIDRVLLDNVKNKIINLPRRSLAQYKDVEITKIIGMKIPNNDKLSSVAVKDYLVILNSFVKYLYERELVNKPYAVNMPKRVSANRDERNGLSLDVISKAAYTAKTTKLTSSYILLFLTGMRPSEAYMCKISVVDAIRCFDLTDKGIKLKTTSSHRLIPVHQSIDNPEEMLEDYRSMKPRMIARGFKVEEGTLYSLRHSFATQLAAKGVEPHIISELLGHTHKGMTLGRYVKGFPIQQLKEAIDKLEPI